MRQVLLSFITLFFITYGSKSFSQSVNILESSQTFSFSQDNSSATYSLPIADGSYSLSNAELNFTFIPRNNGLNRPGCCGGNSSPSTFFYVRVNGVNYYYVRTPNDDNTSIGGDSNGSLSGATVLSGPNKQIIPIDQQQSVSLRLPFSTSNITSVQFVFSGGVDNYSGVRMNSITAQVNCAGGTNNPNLSQTNISNTCPANTANLTNITSSNTPANTELTWHTSATPSAANRVTNPTAVVNGTYYAGFYDSSRNCYGTGSRAVTVSINDCTDSDNDGIVDNDDLDDDNDGIPDSEEICPASTINKQAINVTSSISWTGDLSLVVDGINNPSADNLYSSSNGTNIANQTYLQFDLGEPIVLNKIELQSHPTGIINNGARFIIQGSTNGSSWINVSNEITTSGLTTGAITGYATSENFIFDQNNTAYRYYRIRGVSGTTIFWYLREAEFEAQATNCSNDVDGDGIPNRLDLDSDGDGCFDANESGSGATVNTDGTLSGPYGNNGLANSVETNDTETSNINYSLENNGSGEPIFLDSGAQGSNCIFNASIELEKEGVFNDENNDGIAQIGETITYNFTVRNTGDQDLTNATIIDDVLAFVASFPSLPAGGSTASISTIRNVNESDLDAGSVINKAIAVATTQDGSQIEDFSDDPNNTINLDIEADGEPDDVTVVLLPKDSDNDGIIDSNDLDDDNDGILDTDEQILCSDVNLSYSLEGSINGFRERSGPENTLRNDFVFGTNYSFKMEFNTQIPVVIVVTSGDRTNGYNGSLTIDGDTRLINNDPNRFTVDRFTPTLSDTYTLLLTGNDFRVNAVEIYHAINGQALAKFDFGTSSSPVASSYTGITSTNTSGLISPPTCSGSIDRDTDGDGIADRLDGDSDNDGCSDVLEAGHEDQDNDSILGNSTVTVDNTGLVIGQGGYTGTSLDVTDPNAKDACNLYCGVDSTTSSNEEKQSRILITTTNIKTVVPDWQNEINNSWLNIESLDKGFILSRMASPETSITNPLIGMLVYDTDENVLKLFTPNGWIIPKPKCFD